MRNDAQSPSLPLSLPLKVWDLFTVTELTSIAGKHTRSRLFRSEGGVTDMVVDLDNMLYSCGYDGTVRVHTLNLPNISY